MASNFSPFPHWGPFGGHFAFRRCFVYVAVVQDDRQTCLAIVGGTVLPHVWTILRPPKFIRILRRSRIRGGSGTRMLSCDAGRLVKSAFLPITHVLQASYIGIITCYVIFLEKVRTIATRLPCRKGLMSTFAAGRTRAESEGLFVNFWNNHK